MIEALYKVFQETSGISTDTRECCKDTLFFALNGENFDGNQYALQALEKGAKKVVANDKSQSDNPNIIVVEDTLKTLQKLANYHRKKLDAKIIGITGSNGKTTSKELCCAVLSEKYKVQATKGNLNNHIGVPLTLLSFQKETEIGVVEMGTYSFGEIEMLTKIAEPNLGIITNIGNAHLEGFKTVENIAKEKTALFEWLIKNNGTLFVNNNDPFLKNYEGIKYGMNKKDILSEFPLEMEFENNISKIFPHIFGKYNAYNILGAYTIGKYFKIDEKLILNALAEYQPNNNRSQIIRTKKNNTVIADCYNANPTSMAAAIKSFANIKNNNKHLILGEMKEVGEATKQEHQAILKMASDISNAKSFFIGDSFKGIMEDEKVFDSVDHLISEMEANSISDGYVLVKGSRSNRLEKILPYL